MATFLSRRYMRKPEVVGSTEKVVGPILLLLLGGIVVGFVVHTATNRDYLFEVDASARRGREKARELAVAKRMLPALDVPGWQADNALAIPAAGLAAKLGEDASDLLDSGVVWVYQRTYRRPKAPSRHLSAMLCDMETPAQAFDLMKARRPHGAEEINIGQGGWRTPSQTGFWNGRYYTELRLVSPPGDNEIGDAESTLERAARTIASVQLSYGGMSPSEESPPQAQEPSGPFPAPGVNGWRSPRRVSRFTPENLYEKIDGRAGLYLQFHVVGLTFGTYTHQTDTTRTIDVYWYDMGEAANALGVFRAEAPPGVTHVGIGQQSYQAGGAVFFLKGSSYVQVLPANPDQADGQAALEIARRIGDVINEDDDEGFWALNVLPREGRIPDSFEYLASDAFGLDFLGDVFTADYELDGGRMTLFIHRAEDGAAAEALFDRYMGSLQTYGRIVWRHPDTARRMLAGEVAGVIDVLFVKGQYLGGVAGAEELKPARDAAAGFYDRLSATGD